MLLAWLLALPAAAQFNDSFQDGSLKLNPTWMYNTSDFEIFNGRLHTTNNSGGSVTYGISSPWDFYGVEWFAFEFELQANPSSTNYMDVFIAADTTVGLAKNGYFIRIGDLKDEISFYKLVNGTKTELISGTDGELNKTNNRYQIQVRRKGNQWYFYYTNQVTGLKDTIGFCSDSTFLHSKYCGIKIIQNGTGIIGKHYFDNLYFGPVPVDLTKPKITGVTPLFPDQLLITFSEAVQSQNTSEYQFVQNIAINGIRTIPGFPEQVLLTTTPWIKNKHYALINENTSDISGNWSKRDTIPFFTFYADSAIFGDIIITEVMANPSPAAGNLPELEYVEIKNTSGKFIRLSNCVITDGTSTAVFPDSILKPYQYALLLKSGNSHFGDANTIQFSSFPGLNNDEDYLTIYNAKKEPITYLHYSNKWHSNPIKAAGGWSLELRDTLNYCITLNNWSSNKSIGGTPGIQNSICQQLERKPEFQVMRLYAENIHQVRIFFNQMPDSISIRAKDFLNSQQNATPSSISSFRYSDNSLLLTFDSEFEEDSIYNLEIQSLNSICGNSLVSGNFRFAFSNHSIQLGDVFINELLYDPKFHDNDFVELYNASSHPLNLKYLYLANVFDNGKPNQTACSAPNGYWLLPGEYCWICNEPDTIIQQYSRHQISNGIQIQNMPSYPNSGGDVVLLNANAEILDRMHFNDAMHSPVISVTEGVSLEKMNCTGPSEDPGNWTSAASAAGFATPGLPNSQLVVFKNGKGFYLDNPYFSPDNDGIDDVLKMHYSMEMPGYFIQSSVYSENGIFLHSLHQNISIDQKGSLVWDGKTSQGLIPRGNYVILLEGFHPSGKTIHQKLDFSVLGNL